MNPIVALHDLLGLGHIERSAWPNVLAHSSDLQLSAWRINPLALELFLNFCTPVFKM
jgi:hypothetical protein